MSRNEAHLQRKANSQVCHLLFSQQPQLLWPTSVMCTTIIGSGLTECLAARQVGKRSFNWKWFSWQCPMVSFGNRNDSCLQQTLDIIQKEVWGNKALSHPWWTPWCWGCSVFEHFRAQVVGFRGWYIFAGRVVRLHECIRERAGQFQQV